MNGIRLIGGGIDLECVTWRGNGEGVRGGEIVQFVVVAGTAESHARLARAGNFDRRTLENDLLSVRIVLVILDDARQVCRARKSVVVRERRDGR